MIKRAGTYELETRVNMKGVPGAVTLEKYFNKEDFGGPPHGRRSARWTSSMTANGTMRKSISPPF